MWKKSDAKDHTLQQYIYMKYLEKVNVQRQKVDYRLPESGGWGMDWVQTGMRNVCDNENVLELDCIDSPTFHKSFKSHWTIVLKQLNLFYTH